MDCQKDGHASQEVWQAGLPRKVSVQGGAFWEANCEHVTTSAFYGDGMNGMIAAKASRARA